MAPFDRELRYIPPRKRGGGDSFRSQENFGLLVGRYGGSGGGSFGGFRE